MQNRLDIVLTDNEMADIRDRINHVYTALPFLLAKTPAERRRSGWMVTNIGRELMKKCLMHGRAHQGLLSTQVDLDGLERDLNLGAQLQQIAADLSILTSMVNETSTYLQKEASVTALLVYKQLKVASEAGIGGSVAVEEIQALMPRARKKGRKAD